MTKLPEHNKQRIGVAMSGGVDSSVAALQLLDMGHEVQGFTMSITGTDVDAAAVDSARETCAHLGIPHHVIDLQKTFDERIISYFCNAYFDGLTPNPCVACNRHIKFGALLDQVLNLGMDTMATGHYVRTMFDESSKKLFLLKGADPTKDQSYFLYKLDQKQLSHAIFPNGELTKDRVRKMAIEANLPASRAGESREVCFVPRDYGTFVAERLPQRVRQGRIVDPDGKLLGWHEGVHLYTVGQRRGLGISAPEPLYVLRVDPASNTVVAAPDSTLFQQELLVSDVRMTGGAPPAEGTPAHVKIRYNTPATPATLHIADGGKIRVRFPSPQRAITPGQSAVFYKEDTVFGGGIIIDNLPLK